MWWTEEDISAFEASEDDYRKKLEQIKLQKKDIRDKLKEVVRCLEWDGSLKEAELELRIPVDELDDITEMYKVEVPANLYRMQKEEMTAASVAETDVMKMRAEKIFIDYAQKKGKMIFSEICKVFEKDGEHIFGIVDIGHLGIKDTDNI